LPEADISIGEALERYFGGIRLRSGQEAAVRALQSGSDVLAIMPTGAGKSLIYQLGALLVEGATLVISPLIALIHDQVTDLGRREYPGAAALHSNLPSSEQHAALKALGEGRLRLLYTTPERCAQEDFLAIARRAPIGLLAVDEAHCISEWGHDFRPAYLALAAAADTLGRPPVLGLTASATPAVRAEIVERLRMRDPCVIVRGFDRPNLFYEVHSAEDHRTKRRVLGAILNDDALNPPAQLADTGHGAGIVYTGRTSTARSLSQWLNQSGVLAAYYHGQLKPHQRTAVQERFSEGGVRAIAATNAFGLGIDLPNLSFVAHYDAPPTLEAYYQESGRAGRDGRPARCPLLFSEQDLGRVAFAGGSRAMDRASLEQVASALAQVPAGAASRAELAERAGVSPAVVGRALELLLSAGIVARRRERFRIINSDIDGIDRVLELEARRREHDRTRLEMVRSYARTEGCRRQFLLQYFGEYDAPASCGMCDRCVASAPEGPSAPARATTAAIDAPFSPGDAVSHEKWGAGIVQHTDAETITALFEEAGYRVLDMRIILEDGLLRLAHPQD
jgi:ATP-dependent DNA helicase RecQ